MPDPAQKTLWKAKIVVIINWILLLISSGLFIAFVITACISQESLYSIMEYFSTNQLSSYLEYRRLNGLLSSIGTQITEEQVNQWIKEEEDIKRIFWHSVIVYTGTVWAVALVITLALNILLTVGVKKGDRRQCNLWLTIQVTLFVFGIFGLISQLIQFFNGNTTFLVLFMNVISMTWLLASMMIIHEHRDALGGGQICGCCFVIGNACC